MGLCFMRLHAKFQLNWSHFGLVIANFQLGLVWLRFGLARFGLAKCGSQIDGIVFSEAACKISAQLDLFWLSYSGF